MCKQVVILIFLVSFLQSAALFAGDDSRDVELHNLRWDWQVYDEDAGHYVPFFKNTKARSIRFELDFNKYKNAYLKLLLDENTFVWIEGQLVYRNSVRYPLYFSLDSLHAIYDQHKIYMTIFHPERNARYSSTLVVNKTDGYDTLSKGFLNLRLGQKQTDLFILVSIITLLLIVLFRSSHYRLFQEYFSLGRALQQRQSFDLITAYSPLAWPNIGFVMFYAVLVGNAAMNIGFFHDANSPFDLPMKISNQNSITSGLLISGYCLVFMLAKLLVITASSGLFKLRKLRLVHFFTYFRHSLIIAIIFFSFSLLNGIFEGGVVLKGWKIFQTIVVIVWSGRLIQIFFVLNKIYTFRKLHLFSYLCSTELIPLLLFFKIFLK